MIRVLLVAVFVTACVGLGVWLLAARAVVRDPKIKTVATLRTLAKEAADAAKRGDWAERDRLDYIMENMIRSENPEAAQWNGSRHDDWSGSVVDDAMNTAGDTGRPSQGRRIPDHLRERVDEARRRAAGGE